MNLKSLNHQKQTTFQQHLPTKPHFKYQACTCFSPDDQGKGHCNWVRSHCKEIVHGQAVNREQQAVLLITDVADPDFIPACGNPLKKPVSVGPYVSWDMSHAKPVCEESDTLLSKVRITAVYEYFKTANKQHVNFDAKLINTTSCRHGHTIGLLRIDELTGSTRFLDFCLAKCWR